MRINTKKHAFVVEIDGRYAGTYLKTGQTFHCWNCCGTMNIQYSLADAENWIVRTAEKYFLDHPIKF